MGSGRSKSCRASTEPGGGGGRRRKPMSLLCSLHSSCLASTSHDSDDDVDQQVCNGRRRMESLNQGDAQDCYDDEELKDKNELELDDDCGVVVEEEAAVSNVGGSVQESSTPSRVFSHFKFLPGNISSRLSRASSSRSFNTTYPREVSVIQPARVESPRNPVIDNVVRDIDAMRYGEDRSSSRVVAAEDTPVTSASLLNRSASSIRRTLFGVQDQQTTSPLVREGRYQGLLEHRSDFLERRRRIRSQVRALQRLGSRFESVTGHHDRACVLSGLDQAGRCTCRAGTNRGSTTTTTTPTTDETNARASISRIVLLAEALFEVLDEIHQQSVVLSSQQPSVSSIGSVPAPNDVVDLLPIKQYTKSQSEDSSQVCPLCRGDICRHDPSPELH
ncbi:hypothetical protein IGI04_025192 [Brassica rapa subsp. trilocularis]|uniref:Uncharacterized protein n=1 Tax=Brassica rapa subsp. trilocularis TaxID=1813537 RepID=A0ABQ7M8X1_BRACM|nr:hypothetical protein IGI04_025192 [Brassica rapa subsp. trilocularis]